MAGFVLRRPRSSKISKISDVTPYPSLPLVGLNELRKANRWVLEDRARALTHVINIGDGEMLCRILGRYKLYVPGSDVGFGAHVMMEGVWEGWLTTFVIPRLKPGMVAVDVGANHGYYTLLFADLVEEKGQVVAFEPHPNTARLLRRSVMVNGFQNRTAVIEAAAVAKDGETLNLYKHPGEPKNARLVSGAEAKGNDVAEVKGVTLDTALSAYERIDFMKIDVEGAEEATVLGALGIIRRDRPDILLEFNVHRCADPVGLLDQLEEIYGTLRHIDYSSQLVTSDRAQLLDKSNREDWSLFLTLNP